jgi:hypothetical protein
VLTSYSAGTYTFYGWTQIVSNSKYYAAGSATVTVSSIPVAPGVSLSNISVTSSNGGISIEADVDNYESGYTYEIRIFDGATRIETLTGTIRSTGISRTYYPDSSGTYGVYIYVVSDDVTTHAYGQYSVSVKVAEPSFSTFTVASASSTTPSVTVDYAVSNWTSGSTVTIQARQYGTTTWYDKAGPYSKSSINNIGITLDKAARYQFQAYVYDGSSYYYSDIVYIDLSDTRPDDWAWYSTVAQGSPIELSATEWTAFCTRINRFRAYQSLSSYSFTAVNSGDKISATICNQARTAISGLTDHGTLPSAASAGGKITASYFNGLKTALNAVP